MRTLRTAPVARIVAVAGLAFVVGCSAPGEKPLCDAYADLGQSVEQARSLDLSSATPEQIQSAVNDVTAQLNQVRAAGRGELDKAASDFRLALDEFRESVLAVTPSDSAAAHPLLKESWGDVVVAYQSLKRPLDVQCGLT